MSVTTSAVLRVFLMLSVLAVLISAKPTIYMKNADDKLEPVLVPVSSTVIPLPVYKVGYGLSTRHNSGADEPPGPGSTVYLITAHHKKKAKAVAKKSEDTKEKMTKEESEKTTKAN